MGTDRTTETKRRRGGEPTGLREIAARADVSMMTVSRALRGIDGVSEPVRRRILTLADELGYVPNGNARALAQTNSRLIGISLPNFDNDVFGDILSGMRRTLHGAGYSSVVDTTDYDPARERDWVERMRVWRPAALVLTGCLHDPALRPLLAGGRMPVVEIWDATEDPIDLCVGLDHHAAGRDLGRHIVGLGYRNPAFVGPPAGLDPRADARLAGLAQAFAAAGLAMDRIAAAGDSAFAAGRDGFDRLDRRALPDVVFFHNDNTAFGGMMAAAAAGLDVPRDIGVVGFNHLALSRVLPVPLTTLETPRRRIGELAAQHLLARLAGVRVPPVTSLPCRLVHGGTTRPQ